MYRPTVRYDEIFRDYVDVLFHATYLDRNQIIRAALFTAAHSKEFHKLLDSHKKKDASLPTPGWMLTDDRYWMEQCPKVKEKGEDVNVKCGGTEANSEATRNVVRRESEESGRFEQVARRRREIPSERIEIRNKGGISFTFN